MMQCKHNVFICSDCYKEYLMSGKEQSKMAGFLCGCGFETKFQSTYTDHILNCRGNMKPKMTREEAVKKIGHIIGGHKYLDVLEALGLLEFDERKKHEVMRILGFESKQYIAYTKQDFGYVKIEAWPEGLVLWVGGVIVWKSWATVNNYVVDLARKEYCNGPIAYDCDNPLNTIREMHKVIEKLINQIDTLIK